MEAQETAVVFGMPKAVIDRGVADEVHVWNFTTPGKGFVDE